MPRNRLQKKDFTIHKDAVNGTPSRTTSAHYTAHIAQIAHATLHFVHARIVTPRP